MRHRPFGHQKNHLNLVVWSSLLLCAIVWCLKLVDDDRHAAAVLRSQVASREYRLLKLRQQREKLVVLCSNSHARDAHSERIARCQLALHAPGEQLILLR